jgi:hypothetical protein
MNRMSQREFAKFIGLSPRQVGRLSVIPRRKDGTYDPEQAIQTLLQHYRERLTIAESLCRRFLPGELEDRYYGEHLISGQSGSTPYRKRLSH